MYDSYEDWGYKFTGGAIDNFIRDIEGEEALNNYSEFHDRRNLAEQLMFDLFGQIPYLFYVRRIPPSARQFVICKVICFSGL